MTDVPAGTVMVAPDCPPPDSDVTICVPLTRLPAWMKTFESRTSSVASAIASFKWLVTPALTVALQVSVTVRPSISVLMLPPPSSRSLLRNRFGFCALVPNGFPPLIVLTPTGVFVPGTSAQFCPLIRNAKVSLKGVFEYSLYSSEEKT